MIQLRYLHVTNKHESFIASKIVASKKLISKVYEEKYMNLFLRVYSIGKLMRHGGE